MTPSTTTPTKTAELRPTSHPQLFLLLQTAALLILFAALFAYLQFATPGLPDTDVWKLGANLKWTFNPAAPLRVFVNGGPHLYHFDPGTFEGGANLGLGLQVPAGPRFAVEATYNYHWALTASPDLEVSELQLGTLVSF